MTQSENIQEKIDELEYDIALLNSEINGAEPEVAVFLYQKLVDKRVELAVLKDTEGF